MSNERDPGLIPNRWLHCPRKSETIICERFLAFKTPLSSAFDNRVPVECRFPPEMIFGWCNAVKLKLGLWIDLTNTKRFYDRKIIESKSIQYVKLQCRGHGETPSKEQTRAFIEFVDNFIEERPFDIIGVHCTHGFNRTGFLIVSYLVERLDCPVEASLLLFAKARPPGIYKQDYINELYERYQPDETPMNAPEMPDWCFDYDDSNGNSNHGKKRSYDDSCSSTSHQMTNGDNPFGFNKDDEFEDLDEDDQIDGCEETSSTGEKRPKKKRRKELLVKNAKFMDGVKGVSLVTDQPRLGILQQKVQDMCNWDKSVFPGCQPVSMDYTNLQLLHQIPYRVSWKADGTRYMMLINKENDIYFFDRNNSCFKVETLTFLKAGTLNEHLKDTLLDGEMVIDKYNGETTPRYLVYDIVKISNSDIGKENFYPNRSLCIQKEIIEPRHKGIMKGVIKRENETFSVRQKDFWEISQSVKLLSEKFAKSLQHEPDGLIFQPSAEPYISGACDHVLKWKPSELNSVDFRLKIEIESGPGILEKPIGLLYVAGKNAPFGKICLNSQLKKLNNKIIECTVNKKGNWEFLRERTDKILPNSFNTAASVCESIKNPVTKEILLDFIARYGYQEKMPPPQTNHVFRTVHHPQQHHQQQQEQQQRHD